MAGSQAVIEIRQLFQLTDFEEVLHLQQAIWGFPDIELLPLRFLVVVSKVGGHVFGAYDDDMMVGFCFAIPGIKPSGRPYLHSHMLGVLPAYHNAGIGRRLKLTQREEALSRGIELIEWTFDPLEIKNAYFNMERLGAIVRRYVRNQYGTTTSRLHGGLPTDRCIAEWWVNSARVAEIVSGEVTARPPIEERIEMPEICRDDPQRARALQAEIANRFEAAFGRGLAVVGVERNPAGGTYLLGEWPQ